MTPLSKIAKKSKKINILTAPTHERYQSCFADLPVNFYLLQNQHFNVWKEHYAKIPDNHTFLPKDDLRYYDYDLCLIQNKYGQYQVLKPIADRLGIKTIFLEHTLPMPGWTDEHILSMKNLKADQNVFISEYNRSAWKYEEKEGKIIHHMINTGVFKSGGKKENYVLSVVNDWINRDVFCNFRGWQKIIRGFPSKVVGDTPGLSKPAKNTQELVEEYQRAKIFLNTSLVSPIPTALLESMACGCVPISTATCMIPEIIENGVNGFISNDYEELRHYIDLVLSNDDLAAKLSQAAIETINRRFNKTTFENRWMALFDEMCL